MPSDMLRDDDLIDDDYQGRAYDPFLPARGERARRVVSSSDLDKWRAAFVALLVIGAVAVHFIALTPHAGTVTQVSFAAMIGALFLCLFPRAVVIGGLLFLVAGFTLIVSVVAYLVHGP